MLFRSGNHRCLGAPLAKLEVSEMLATISLHLADLRVDQGAVQSYPSFGGVLGYSQVPVTFTPGRPLPLDDLG